MDISVQHRSFSKRRLGVRPASFWKGSRVLVDDQLVPGKGNRYEVEDDEGRLRQIVLKQMFLDPIPTVQIDAEPPIALARPLRWYEWAWMALPAVLVVAGGGLGALCGMLALWTSTRIFRSQHSTLAKYVFSAGVSAAATTVFIVLAAIVQYFLAEK